MRRLTLREWQPTFGVPLTIEQRDTLGRFVTVRPTAGVEGAYDLIPGSLIGAVTIDDLEVVVRPKVSVDRIFFMLSYAVGRIRPQDVGPALEQADDLVEALVAAFVRHVRTAIGKGVLQGYRTTDETSLTLRGRLRVGDQLRRRFAAVPPAEVTYDDFTVDIEVNRLLRAATRRLLRLRLRSERSRHALRGIDARLDGVEVVGYDSRRLPVVTYDRRNGRYRDAVTLAQFILRSTAFDLKHGAVPAAGFLVDMNKVFEDFLVQSLREAIGPGVGELAQGAGKHTLLLDEDERIVLRPDLSLWRDGVCYWLGDAKYKRITSGEYPNADIYQATAYAIATGLERAVLIYANAERPAARYRVVNAGKVVDVISIDLSVPPAELLRQIDQIAVDITAAALSRAAA